MTGLQTARILKRRGVPVLAIAKDLSHFCCRTNACQKIFEADITSEELVLLLEDFGPSLGQKAVLFPCTDLSVLMLSRHRQRLERWYSIALPDPEVVETLMDKVRFCNFAKEAGLPIPGTFFLSSRQEAEQATGSLTFPCILKPPIKTPMWESHTKAKVYKASSPGELLKLYDQCSQWADLLMVQEWVEGKDANLYSCNCYFDDQSEPLVTFIARKLRQWPPETGTSCLGEECRNDIVLEESIRLFRSVHYRGLGYVEMKRDDRSGKHYIIEPNIGRPTGRSAIAEAGGVELIYTMYCDLAGHPLPVNREQTYGSVKWIYLRKDIQSALYYWRRGDLSLLDWWRSWQGRKAYAIFSRNDLAPFLFDFIRVFGLLIGRSKGKKPRVQSPKSPVS